MTMRPSAWENKSPSSLSKSDRPRSSSRRSQTLLSNARHKAVSAGRDFWEEHRALEAEEERPEPVDNVADDSRPETGPGAATGSGDGAVGAKKRHTRITISRLIDRIRPTIRIRGVHCKACEEGVGKHSQGRRDRFDEEYRETAQEDAVKRHDQPPEGDSRASGSGGLTAGASEPPTDPSGPPTDDQLQAMVC